MEKNTIIIHSGEMNQTGFVRLFFPAFITEAKEFNGGMKVEHHWHPVQDANLLQDVQSVVIQRPIWDRDIQLVKFYAGYRNTYKFNLVFEWDDILWECWKERLDAVKSIANLPNFVVCSTRKLAEEWKKISNRPAIVLPNGVAGYSCVEPHNAILADLEKPKVLYGGAAGHEDDFWDNWKTWLNDAVSNDKIELHTFVDMPFITAQDKIIKHPFTTCIDWMNAISKIRPDFYIAPLDNTLFNKCKSDLKVRECAALGAVFLGSDFACSPYSYLPNDMLIQKDTNIADKFEKLCNAKVYNKNREFLRDSYLRKNWDIMSDKFMMKWYEAYGNGREV